MSLRHIPHKRGEIKRVALIYGKFAIVYSSGQGFERRCLPSAYIFVSRLKIGHGLVLLDVSLSLTWRARDQCGRSMRILNLSDKNAEKRSFSVCFHLNRFICVGRIVAIAVGCKPTASFGFVGSSPTRRTKILSYY